MGLYQQMKRKLDGSLAFEEKNTALIMLEAVFAGIVLQLTNPFYQLFASAMGADEVAIGLISSLPAFCALFVLLPASLMMDRVKEKKKFLMTTITICGVVLPLVALSPFLGDRGYWFFIIGISLWNAPYLCYTVSWQSYFSDLYPANNRALPYSRRQMVYNAVPVFTIMMVGAVQSYLCHTTEQKILAFQIFYFIAFGAAMLQRKMIEKTELPEYMQNRPAAEKQSIGKLVGEFWGAVKALSQHPQFCFFLALLFCLFFSWQIAWPMFFLFLVTENGINEITKS
ncbi:MAG: MFS transporter, partial [Clostridia bacterium]|nr:MFS transporter [Clostridia bacterium]